MLSCLILLIQLWTTKIDIILLLSSMILQKGDNLPKFLSQDNKIFVSILIILVFSKSGVQYMWQRKISVM